MVEVRLADLIAIYILLIFLNIALFAFYYSSFTENRKINKKRIQGDISTAYPALMKDSIFYKEMRIETYLNGIKYLLTTENNLDGKKFIIVCGSYGLGKTMYCRTMSTFDKNIYYVDIPDLKALEYKTLKNAFKIISLTFIDLKEDL